MSTRVSVYGIFQLNSSFRIWLKLHPIYVIFYIKKKENSEPIIVAGDKLIGACNIVTYIIDQLDRLLAIYLICVIFATTVAPNIQLLRSIIQSCQKDYKYNLIEKLIKKTISYQSRSPTTLYNKSLIWFRCTFYVSTRSPWLTT